jgi:hypothetical protein
MVNNGFRCTGGFSLKRNRTLEVVGSTPIGSTNIFKGLDTVPTPSHLSGFSFVRTFVLMFQFPAWAIGLTLGACGIASDDLRKHPRVAVLT